MKNLNPELYRHPGERAARAKLEKIPGFNTFIGMITTNFNAAAERQTELGSMARVGPGVYPALHELWRSVLERFGLDAVPLHIAAGLPQRAALRGGNDRPAVILDASLLTVLPEREMEALLAMQAGSVRLGNTALIAAADMLRWFLDYYGIAGAPAVLPAWGIENWRRHALFSADRAASLATGGPDAVLSWLDRVSGAAEKAWGGVTKPDELRVQGLEAVARRDSAADKQGVLPGSGLMRRLALAMNRGNSVGVIRRVDLEDWFASGVPARILSGELTEPARAEARPDAEPSVAYWGEFAGCCDGEEEEKSRLGKAADTATQAFGDLKDTAEKGLGQLFRAGEAFWTTLTESAKGNDAGK